MRRNNPHADRWRVRKELLPTGRASFSAAVVRTARHNDSDMILAFGGFTVTAGGPVATDRVEAFPVHGRP